MNENYSASVGQDGYLRAIPRWHKLIAGLLLACLLSAGVFGGYRMGLQANAEAIDNIKDFKQLLSASRRDQEAGRLRTSSHLDALALRLGAMQSELFRLEALGTELAKAGSLDLEEFNFSESPPRGGVAEGAGATTLGLEELASEIESLARNLDDRAHKLSLMQRMLLGGRVLGELEPQGLPVRKGWISSEYGHRSDPFTGKRNFHHGVDIAGKKDSEVLAVASGVVTDAGRKGGYGYLVELVHADGLITRYAHNSKIFVRVGDLVSKGDVIGRMGSTGRSTGPHVHFEIVSNGKSINPSRYLRMKRVSESEPQG